MQNFDIKGLLVPEDFLLNYSKFNLTMAEAFFILQLSYVSGQGRIIFDAKKYADMLKISQEKLFENVNYLRAKNIISVNSTGYLVFNISIDDDRYYSMKELLSLAEKNVNRPLTSKEIDIVMSWFDKKISKNQIDDAYKISTNKNISYINAIINNRVETYVNNDEDDILNYDWLAN